MVCPSCGFDDGGGDEDLYYWDVIGACNDNIFCPSCHVEFDPETGRVHRCNRSAEEAARLREAGTRCE